MGADGVFEQRTQRVGSRIKVLWTVEIFGRRASGRIPPWTRARGSAAIRQMQQKAMTWGHGKDVLNECNWFGHAAEQQIRSQRILRQISLHEVACEKSAKLRRKNETLRSLRIVERLDADGIARKEQYGHGGKMFAKIQKSKSKHTAQLLQKVLAPLFPSMNKDFGIRFRVEPMASEGKAFAELLVIVELAVEDHDHIAGFVPDRLLTASEIDDAQAAHSESESRDTRIVCEKTVFIRAAMNHRRSHGPDARFSLLRIARAGE